MHLISYIFYPPKKMALRQLLRKQLPTMTSLPGHLRHMTAVPPVRTFPPLPQGMLDKADDIIGNVYIKNRRGNPVYIRESDPRAVLLRIDLPGTNGSTLNFQLHENLNRVDFQAYEDPTKIREIYPQCEPVRTYNGSIIFDPDRFRVKDYMAELVNGALWIQVRSFNPYEDVSNMVDLILDRPHGPAYNRFVTQGVDRFFLLGYKEDAFVWAVDMPGLCEGDQKLIVEGDLITFQGKDSQLPPFETDWEKFRREFEGRFEVDPKTYDAEACKAELYNGVLWIEVPRYHKLPPGSEFHNPGEWIRLHFGHLRWQIENMQGQK